VWTGGMKPPMTNLRKWRAEAATAFCAGRAPLPLPRIPMPACDTIVRLCHRPEAMTS
jgi:hypothetical protein